MKKIGAAVVARAFRNAPIFDAAFLLVFSIALCWFAKAQNIWVDETTQLSGITLTFGDMLKWLGGHDVTQFGVPGDRMPPLSYMIDWMWLRLSGSSELGFRLFHAAFLVSGVAIILAAARRSLGRPAWLVALAMLGLSPKLMQTAVEIRAYPIFFAITCAQLAIFLRLLHDRQSIDKRLLALFSILSIAAICTHFFGLVSDFSFFSALVLAHIRNRRTLPSILAAGVATVAASIGILPFVLSALAHSGVASGQEPANAQRYFEYPFKLLGDSANLISLPAAALFFGGTLVLFLASVVAVITRLSAGVAKPVDWLLVVVTLGIAATLAISCAVKGFDPLKASYSTWLFPPLTLIIANGVVELIGMRHWQKIAVFPVAVLTVGAAISTYAFLVNPSEFIHGPQKFVDTLYDQMESPKAAVYEVGAAWPWSYFPLVFDHNGELAQYRADTNGAELIRIATSVPQPAPQQLAVALAPYTHILLVDIRLRSYRDIRQCHAQACPQFARGRIETALLQSGHWQEISSQRKFGLYDAEVKTFTRID